MQMKNLSFFEKHVEKLILGVGALTAIVVVIFYVIGQPYAVKLGGRAVAPGDVADAVNEPTRKLQRAMNSGEVPDELKTSIQEYSQRYMQRDRGVKMEPWLQPLGDVIGLAPRVFEGSEAVLVEYLVPQPPAPTKVQGRSSMHVMLGEDHVQDIIDQSNLKLAVEQFTGKQDFGANASKRYAKFVDADLPRDFEAVSVMAEFDLDAWEQALKQGPHRRRIPERFWRGRLLMTDAILERQQRHPESGAWGAYVDGQWREGEVVRIDPLPGTLDLRQPLSDIQPVDLRHLVEQEAMQQLIVRPPFPPVEKRWLPPDLQPKKRNPEEDRRLKKVNDRIQWIDKQLRALAKSEEIQALREQQAKRRRRPQLEGRNTRTQDSDRLRGAGGRSGGGRTSRSPRAAAPGANLNLPGRMPGPSGRLSEETQTKQAKLNAELEKLLLEQDILFGLVEPQEDVEEGKGLSMPPTRRMPSSDARGRQQSTLHDSFMRGDPFMNRPFNPQPGAGFGRQQNSRLPVRGGRQGGELREPEERAPGTVTIWAHDLTVKPGATYRYRLRAGAMNPFFLREKILVEGQKPLAKQLTLVSAPSKWTEAISIHRKTYFFLVDGSRRDDEGRMELYRRFDGSWRRQELEVRPGEPIGGMHRLASERFELDVDLSVGAIVVDLNEVPAARHKARMTKRMLYLDTDSQSLQQRTAEQDGADEIRVHLFNQVKLDDQLAAMER